MNKLAAVLTFVSVMTAYGWSHERAVEVGSDLIVDLDCTVEEAVVLALI